MSDSQEQTLATSLPESSVPLNTSKVSGATVKSSTRVVKRYQNRKLYDTVDSCYITFKDILDLVMEGKDIKIIENVNKKDITDNIILSSLADHTKDLSSDEICSILSTVGKFIKARGERNGF